MSEAWESPRVSLAHDVAVLIHFEVPIFAVC